jgi:Na+/melibiose symporter-like transporter
MAYASFQPRILWLQVWGLAAIQGAIALTWVIYNLYLIDLLVLFGFTPGFAVGLLVLENILAAIMEPLMGSFSDDLQHWVGSRFPLIVAGILLASVLFISIPALVVWGDPVGVWRWILPVVAVVWSIAMTVFRSPALSLLGRYAIATSLPQAASILTLVGGVAGAMGPLAGGLILSLGPLVAFFIGSITLLGAAAALRAVGPTQTVHPAPESVGSLPKDVPINPGSVLRHLSYSLSLVFGAGLGTALGFRLMMQTFPRILETQIPSANPALILGLIFMAVALTALPAGAIARQVGNRPSMTVGLTLMALLCALMAIMGSSIVAVGLAIALGISFSIVSNGTLPFALSMVPSHRAGLGVGMYFSGSAVASSLFGAFLSQPDRLSNLAGALLAAIAFLAAAGCVLISKSYGHC